MKTQTQKHSSRRACVCGAHRSYPALILAAALLALTAAGCAKSKAAGVPPETNSIVVRQLGLEKLVGTHVVNYTLAANTRHEWYFLDGHFLGTLPLQAEWRLLPGSYEERVVGQDDGGFWLVKRACLVTRGESNASSNTNAWTNITVRATLALPWSQTEYRLDCRSLEEVEKQLVRIEEEQNDRWDAFAQSELWTPIADASGYTRLTRNYVWMDLPLALGGPREVDTGQLKSLRDYFVSHLPSNSFTVETPSLSGAEREAAVKAVTNLVEAGRKQLRRNIDQTLVQLQRNLSRQVGSLAQTSK